MQIKSLPNYCIPLLPDTIMKKNPKYSKKHAYLLMQCKHRGGLIVIFQATKNYLWRINKFIQHLTIYSLI